MATTGNEAKERFPVVHFRELSPADQDLLRAAQKVLGQPYNPYSGFSVAAAVLTKNGKVVTGTNVENAAFGTSMCAERTALVTAHNDRLGEECIAVAVVARAKEGPTTKVTAPCGECRQMITEFAARSGVQEGFRVLMATTKLNKVVATTIGELLPLAFTPADLLLEEEG